MKELPKLQEEYEWLKEVDSCSLRCAIFNLEDAYKNYYLEFISFRKLKSP